MQAQKEAPPDMQCKDKFLLQSVIVPDGTTTKDITSEMFNKEAGHVVEEFKLRVASIPDRSLLGMPVLCHEDDGLARVEITVNLTYILLDPAADQLRTVNVTIPFNVPQVLQPQSIVISDSLGPFYLKVDWIDELYFGDEHEKEMQYTSPLMSVIEKEFEAQGINLYEQDLDALAKRAAELGSSALDGEDSA